MYRVTQASEDEEQEEEAGGGGGGEEEGEGAGGRGRVRRGRPPKVSEVLMEGSGSEKPSPQLTPHVCLSSQSLHPSLEWISCFCSLVMRRSRRQARRRQRHHQQHLHLHPHLHPSTEGEEKEEAEATRWWW